MIYVFASLANFKVTAVPRVMHAVILFCGVNDFKK